MHCQTNKAWTQTLTQVTQTSIFEKLEQNWNTYIYIYIYIYNDRFKFLK